MRISSYSRAALILVVLMIGILGSSLFDTESVAQRKSWRHWILQIRTYEETQRNEATQALQKMGARLVPALVRALRQKEPLLAMLRIRYGSKMPVGLERLLPEPIGAARIRADAADALGVIGPGAMSAVPALIRALNDESEAVCINSMVAIGKIGPLACQAVPALIPFLSDRPQHIRVYAANALGKIGPPARAAVPVLMLNLINSTPLVRASSALALGKIGRSADSITPALIDLLQDPDDYVRSSAAMALGKFGSLAKEAVTPLAQALKDSNNTVRICAAEALGEIGSLARPAIPALLESQRNDFAGLGRFAAIAINKIEPSLNALAITE